MNIEGARWRSFNISTHNPFRHEFVRSFPVFKVNMRHVVSSDGNNRHKHLPDQAMCPISLMAEINKRYIHYSLVGKLFRLALITFLFP